MIQNDKQITEAALAGMITPFEGGQVRGNADDVVISYGLSSFGYDIRLRQHYKLFTYDLSPGSVVDPKDFNEDLFIECEALNDSFLMPPHSFILGESVEIIDMPEDTLAVCLGKSTYARCGLIVNVTPLEPGWRGTITIEISNTTPLPARVYANEGIAQLLFFKGEPCQTSYKDRQGKYQDQRGVTLPKA